MRTCRLVCLLACFAIAIPALAQNGFPLKGSWSGDWWLKVGQENHILLEFNWDGKTATGTLNPGTDNATLQKLTVTPPAGLANAAGAWPVHFEADLKDESGKTVHYVVDGKLQNIGAFRKFVTGTWSAGAQKGEFKIVRN